MRVTVDGKLCLQKSKMVIRLKQILKSTRKGGDIMSEIRKPMADSIEDVRNGKMPLDTAEQVHRLGHRHNMDRFADEKEARRLGDEAVAKKLNEAKEKLNQM